eukprot:3544244-Amphidinium_carterae.1
MLLALRCWVSDSCGGSSGVVSVGFAGLVGCPCKATGLARRRPSRAGQELTRPVYRYVFLGARVLLALWCLLVQVSIDLMQCELVCDRQLALHLFSPYYDLNIYHGALGKVLGPSDDFPMRTAGNSCSRGARSAHLQLRL